MAPQKRYIPLFKDIPAKRQPMPEIEVADRVKDFSEVELGFTREQAVQEASRCLSCRKCLGCGLCAAVCPLKAIDFGDAEREIEIDIDSIVIAPGVETARAGEEEKLGYGKYTNVVTCCEFEHILSDTGPYGGILLRPSDGDIPGRIAFIQGTTVKNPDLAYRQAVKAALLAREKNGGLECCLFINGVSQEELSRHDIKNRGIGLRQSKVVAVGEKDVGGSLTVQCADGKETSTEDFDMAVLINPLAIPQHLIELGGKLGLGLEGKTFWEVDDITLKETSRPGVSLAGYHFE